jgi:FKBP-type peptidyl-prolyl cis-trans isomerase
MVRSHSLTKKLIVAAAAAALAGTAWAAGPDSPEATAKAANTSRSSIKSDAKAEPKAVTLPSGLKYVDLELGTGTEFKTNMLVLVNYEAWLADGTKFDSSYDRREPFNFKVGAGQVIQGWDEGVVGMKVGGKRRLTIPPALGYGEAGAPPRIPPNATLTFEVKALAAQ